MYVMALCLANVSVRARKMRAIVAHTGVDATVDHNIGTSGPKGRVVPNVVRRARTCLCAGRNHQRTALRKCRQFFSSPSLGARPGLITYPTTNQPPRMGNQHALTEARVMRRVSRVRESRAHSATRVLAIKTKFPCIETPQPFSARAWLALQRWLYKKRLVAQNVPFAFDPS